MPELTTLSLSDLELVGVTQSNTEMEVSVNFPFSTEFPAATGLELDGGHNAVYFEIAPGKELGTHTDSPEELVVCLEGEAIEAWAGDATDQIAAGDLAVIPPMAPHGFRNGGDTMARFLGIFSDRTTVSEFEEELEPFGMRVFEA
jgi:quercetin dioxygenase-like cupin family protein